MMMLISFMVGLSQEICYNPAIDYGGSATALAKFLLTYLINTTIINVFIRVGCTSIDDGEC